ncbi:MAG TPA: ParA family protein [Chthoniobacterales bacterium]|jgi:chromosome partitioning protein
MKTIAVANQKGGVGKTTTSVNLAAGLAAAGQRILLVDLDPQGNATSAMLTGEETAERRSLYHTIVGDVPAPELVHATRFENLSTIPATLEMAGAEAEVARLDDHNKQIRKALAAIRDENKFDYAILDCPPSLGVLMTNALVAADELLVPIQCEYYALEGLGLLMQVMNLLRNGGDNPDLTISGLVLTMFDSRTNLNQAVVRDVREHFQEVVFDTVIPRSIRFGEAPSFGRTIFEHDPAGGGAQAYTALAEEFVKRQQANIRFIPPSVAG